jgi:hypothetical protein
MLEYMHLLGCFKSRLLFTNQLANCYYYFINYDSCYHIKKLVLLRSKKYA